MNTTTAIFKALSDETRLRLLVLLERKGPLCVCELTGVLKVVQPKVSRHLAELRNAGLVEDQRRGLWVFYRIASNQPEWVRQVLRTTSQASEGVAPFSDDLANVRLIANENDRCEVKPMEVRPS